ncbi:MULTISPECIES: helix-turn-helix domain-containing protein [Peribacillus]|uniref:helix-turn-helix domain-containing protein n=1 Tax=Peribacillus TaxID=2675229 RepID=UPI00207A92D9|nr:helix-turn-helix transcriptional regulator [Peribacillus asahii]USK86165.1 helix-turn-helix domain-containing protein [Peribacillus asahii]
MNDREMWLLKRRRKHITQKEIAEYLQVTQSMISHFEKANRDLSQEKIELYKKYIIEK